MASEHPTRNEHFGKYLALGIGTHIMWGFFPLYFHLLEPAGSLEIIVHRALWAFIACLIALALTRSLPRMWRVIRTPALMAPLAAAGFLVVINWTTYIYAIPSSRSPWGWSFSTRESRAFKALLLAWAFLR